MSWDYANMTHEAKLHGGPDAFVAWIIDGAAACGRKIGRKEMIPWLGGSFGLGIGLGYVWKAYLTAKLEVEKREIQEEAEKTLGALENATAHCAQNAAEETSEEATEETEPQDQLSKEGFRRTAICEMCGREFNVPKMEGHIGPKFGYAGLENIRSKVGNVCDECAMAFYYSEHEEDRKGNQDPEESSTSV